MPEYAKLQSTAVKAEGKTSCHHDHVEAKPAAGKNLPRMSESRIGRSAIIMRGVDAISLLVLAHPCPEEKSPL